MAFGIKYWTNTPKMIYVLQGRLQYSPTSNVFLRQCHQSSLPLTQGKVIINMVIPGDKMIGHLPWKAVSTSTCASQLRFQPELCTSKAAQIKLRNVLCITEVILSGKHYFKPALEQVIICSLLESTCNARQRRFQYTSLKTLLQLYTQDYAGRHLL